MDVEIEKFSVNLPDAGCILKLCFAVVFFYNMSEDRKRQAGILDMLDDHCAMTGDRYRWTQNPKTRKWKRLKSGINSYIHPREWVLTNPNYKWTLIYHSGEKPSDASDVEVYSFNWGDTPIGDDTSFVRVHFPISVLQDPSAIADIAEVIRRWGGWVCPDHGYAGFCLAESHGYERGGNTAPYEYTLAQRFPGLDIYANVPHSSQLGKYIKGVNWLTILSDAFLNRIGGLDAVRKKMEDLPVLEFTGGAILQAGPLPLLGDREKDLPMTDYQRVAAIVEPLRHKNYDGGAERLAPEPKFDKQSYMAWLARFSPRPE